MYNFGFILLESLIGPLPTTKGEAFILNEMVTKRIKNSFIYFFYLIETKLVNRCCCNATFYADVI